ncbi:hypothetical protein NQ317_007415 [Molorchus minor]|uniref:Uncharacterized protein n=1 Tax=Molorchus minor TaxID=1323400 RepID=A0ABQ9IRK0_9CUCU|nr:hypothetical protein NQ317_007415 [Molorchus minor]
MVVDLYYAPASPPCRTVLLAAKAIGVDLNLKELDLRKGEHTTPEYLKLNPQHTIPTIVDNGYSLSESRAIITYLQNKYGKNDSLYPKDPKQRGLVDQRLYFDAASLYPSFVNHYFLDTFLENSEFVAGNQLTLADLSLVATVSTIEVFNHDLSPFKNITRWFSKVKQVAPGYDEVNDKPLDGFRKIASGLTKK